VGGIALLGNLLERYTDFRTTFTAAFTKRCDGIPWGDVLLTFVASLRPFRFFKLSLQIVSMGIFSSSSLIRSIAFWEWC
jgi:hypothetical protein